MLKVLMTGASGYIANQLLPTFRERYELSLLDVTDTNRNGDTIDGVQITNLIDHERSQYASHFECIDAVVHLGYKRRSGDPLDHYLDEKQNVDMAYNVLRTAHEAGVPRVVIASSNHAADWYEHHLIHTHKLESLDPYTLPLSDNFYGWAKATYEHLGFMFANGTDGMGDSMAHQQPGETTSGLGVVMVRIGAPRELQLNAYEDPASYKRDLGAYISQRDLVQLFTKAIETPNIDNEHGIPWQVVYGISNNTRAFWSLSNARTALDYEPEDDSEITFAEDIHKFLIDAPGGRVG